jgi:hypothetical protein
MLREEQDRVIIGIRYRINETYVLKVIKVGILGGWVTRLEYKKWITAESLLSLKQK